MIIESLMNLIYNIFDPIISSFNIPKFSDAVRVILDTIIGYFDVGLKILKAYINWDLAVTLFNMCLFAFAGYELLRLVFFILRKVPMFGTK